MALNLKPFTANYKLNTQKIGCLNTTAYFFINKTAEKSFAKDYQFSIIRKLMYIGY
jgi:hypothetical protein